MIELIFFFLLVCKHAIADLWLQARLVNKGSKADLRTPRLWIHCLDHAVLTFFVALVIVGIKGAMLAFALDFVLHFIIDHTKRVLQNKYNVKDQSKKYWQWAAIDQVLHFTTYLIIVLLVFH